VVQNAVKVADIQSTFKMFTVDRIRLCSKSHGRKAKDEVARSYLLRDESELRLLCDRFQRDSAK
jgi:hypothetical protein